MIKSETFSRHSISYALINRLLSSQGVMAYINRDPDPARTVAIWDEVEVVILESNSPTALPTWDWDVKAQNLNLDLRKINEQLKAIAWESYTTTMSPSGTPIDEWEDEAWSEDELSEMLVFKAKPGAEVIQEGLTGLWADRGITDSVEWLDQLRKSERSKW